jgi:hypothetical protein
VPVSPDEACQRRLKSGAVTVFGGARHRRKGPFIRRHPLATGPRGLIAVWPAADDGFRKVQHSAGGGDAAEPPRQVGQRFTPGLIEQRAEPQ